MPVQELSNRRRCVQIPEQQQSDITSVSHLAFYGAPGVDALGHTRNRAADGGQGIGLTFRGYDDISVNAFGLRERLHHNVRQGDGPLGALCLGPLDDFYVTARPPKGSQPVDAAPAPLQASVPATPPAMPASLSKEQLQLAAGAFMARDAGNLLLLQAALREIGAASVPALREEQLEPFARKLRSLPEFPNK